MTETAMLRKPAAQPHHLIESHHRRRQSSPTLRSWFAIGSQHPYTQCTGIRMRTHKTDSILENMLTDNGIRIQQKNQITLALADSKIVGTGKSVIMRTGYNMEIRISGSRETLFEIFHRSILRMIINHDNLCRIATCITLLPTLQHADSFLNRTQTLGKIVLHIIAYYDNTKFHIE